MEEMGDNFEEGGVYNETSIYASDVSRWIVFKETLKELKNYPLGKSFVNDPHIFFPIDIIGAGGYVGIVFLMLIGFNMLKLILFAMKENEIGCGQQAIASAILAWMLSGLMYSSVYLGFGWMLIGMLLSLKKMSVDRGLKMNIDTAVNR